MGSSQGPEDDRVRAEGSEICNDEIAEGAGRSGESEDGRGPSEREGHAPEALRAEGAERLAMDGLRAEDTRVTAVDIGTEGAEGAEGTQGAEELAGDTGEASSVRSVATELDQLRIDVSDIEVFPRQNPEL